MRRKSKIQIGFITTLGLKKELEKYAEKEGRTITDVINSAIYEYLGYKKVEVYRKGKK